MKTKNLQTKNRQTKNIHLLSELVQRVQESTRHAAMEGYLDGNIHTQMLIANELVEQCTESQRKLLKGEIAPHLDISCCAETFRDVLTSSPAIYYEACELPGIDDEYDLIDEEIDDKTFAKLSKLPVDELCKKLIADYDCSTTEYYQTHKVDRDTRHRYYEAVLRRFEAAAKYAKAIGSESARLWLEAICLISPRSQMEAAAETASDFDLDADCVAQAYEVAQRAQRALWVDDRLRKLPAAKLPRKTSTRRG